MKKKGFTLIELISVIVLIGIIALITVPLISGIISSSKEEARKKSIIEYANAVNLVQTEGNFYDKSIEELVNMKLKNNNVRCEITKFEEVVNSPLLYNCNVEDKGSYCYINGNVYNNDTQECELAYTIATTGKIPYLDPSITSTQIPVDTEYAQKKEISIVYPFLTAVDSEYYIRVSQSVKLDNVIAICGTEDRPSTCVDSIDRTIEANTWYRLSGNVKFDINKNLTIDAMTGNTNKVTHVEDKIDATAPSVSMVLSSKSDRIVVAPICSDLESGITKYEYKIDDGEYVLGTTGHVFYELSKNEEYEISLRCTNGSGMTDEKTEKISTKDIVNPTIVQYSQTPESGTWAQSRVIRITFDGTGVENPKYYYSLDGINWTETSETTVDITFTKDGELYAKTIDENKNTANAATFTVMNIDTSIPTITISGIPSTITQGDSYVYSSYVTRDYSNVPSGEKSFECTINNQAVTNTSTLSTGTYTVYCTTISNSGISATTSYTFTVNPKASVGDYIVVYSNETTNWDTGGYIDMPLYQSSKSGNALYMSGGDIVNGSGRTITVSVSLSYTDKRVNTGGMDALRFGGYELEELGNGGHVSWFYNENVNKSFSLTIGSGGRIGAEIYGGCGDDGCGGYSARIKSATVKVTSMK